MTAAQTLKIVAAARDGMAAAATGGVVLLYHRVGARSPSGVDLPARVFAQQVDELARSGRLTPLDDFLSQLSSETSSPTDPVAVTFDDGTADFAEIALPMLEQASVPVTLYLATEFIETGQAFPRDGRPLSWSALADALTTGLVTIGSHTHTHALLDRMPAAEVATELDRSIKLIEDRLGITPEHFAYPKAVLGSPAAEEAVRQRFRSACIAGTRPNRYGCTDPYRLNRSPIQVADGMRWFRRKLAGGLRFEDDVRRLANRRRYARAFR
jgi:peptidoglycan/xylan/chitin deacetylase (PgdA/CDA1 family)